MNSLPGARLALLATTVILTSCHRPQVAGADPDEVIATFTGGSIRRGDVSRDIERRLQKDPLGVTLERRKEIVKEILSRKARIAVLLKEAETAGIPSLPRSVSRIRARENALLAEDWLATHGISAAKISDARVEEEVTRRSSTISPETRGFSHIYLRADAKDPAAGERARKTMAGIEQELADGAAFEELARRHSDSITARAGGQVRGAVRSQLKDEMAEQIFSLAEGQVGKPLVMADGIHLFRVDRIIPSNAGGKADLAKSVRHELETEALRAAADAERAKAFDESGVLIEESSLAPGAPRSAVVLTFGTTPLSREALDDLVAERLVIGRDLRAAARTLVENARLAVRRRETPIKPELANRLQQGTKDVVLSTYREMLVEAFPVTASPEEEAALYANGQKSLPFLTERVMDLLFFPQEGSSVAKVYREGELVSKALRDGATFDTILTQRARVPHVEVVRKLDGVDYAVLRAESLTLFRAAEGLKAGEVSPPVYLSGEVLRFGRPEPVVEGKGVVFLRLVETRPVPLEKARPRLRQVVMEAKRADVIGAIKVRLEKNAQLKILSPAG
ncbi:MAG: peptidylprolyl isomerase [Thermoanaerobaculia bacterium]